MQVHHSVLQEQRSWVMIPMTSGSKGHHWSKVIVGSISHILFFGPPKTAVHYTSFPCSRNVFLLLNFHNTCRPIVFFVYGTANLPSQLLGDESRGRLVRNTCSNVYLGLCSQVAGEAQPWEAERPPQVDGGHSRGTESSTEESRRYAGQDQRGSLQEGETVRIF